MALIFFTNAKFTTVWFYFVYIRGGMAIEYLQDKCL